MKVIDSTAKSSKSRENLFMARCMQFECVDHPKMTQGFADFSDKSTSAEEKEFDLTKLVNPCDAIKAQRLERRNFERI